MAQYAYYKVGNIDTQIKRVGWNGQTYRKVGWNGVVYVLSSYYEYTANNFPFTYEYVQMSDVQTGTQTYITGRLTHGGKHCDTPSNCYYTGGWNDNSCTRYEQTTYAIKSGDLFNTNMWTQSMGTFLHKVSNVQTDPSDYYIDIHFSTFKPEGQETIPAYDYRRVTTDTIPSTRNFSFTVPENVVVNNVNDMKLYYNGFDDIVNLNSTTQHKMPAHIYDKITRTSY